MEEADARTATAAGEVPWVSVIVSVFNKSRFVRETLLSVGVQTHQQVELIVVDDGSTDDSLSIVRSLLGETAAQIFSLKNGGVSAARNFGYQRCSARASYLLFLDADDVLLENALARMVAHLEKNRAAAACYSTPILIDAEGKSLGADPDDARWARSGLGRRAIPREQALTPLESLWSRFRAVPSSCLIRRAAYEKTKGWDSALCRPAQPFHAEDKDLLIQLSLAGEIDRLAEPLLKYRVLESGHKEALYQGLKAIDRKWWNAPLPPEQRARVRQAIAFDARVAALDCAAAFRAALSKFRFGDALVSAARFARAVLRWLTLGARLRERRR